MTPNDFSNKLTALADLLQTMHLELRDLSHDIPGLPMELERKDEIIQRFENRYIELLEAHPRERHCSCVNYMDCHMARERGVECFLEKK